MRRYERSLRANALTVSPPRQPLGPALRGDARLRADAPARPRPQVARAPGLIERTYVVISLVFLSGAFLTLFSPGARARGAAADDLAATLVLYTIYVIAGVLLLRAPRRLGRLMWRIRILLVPVALALASTLWSAAPEITFRHSILLIATTLFGIYFASTFSVESQLRLLSSAMILMIVCSVCFVLVVPQYGRMQDAYAGAWRGVFGHKNALARVMVLSVIVHSLRSGLPGRFRLAMPFVLASSLAVILMSQSATSAIIALALIMMVPAYRALRLRAKVLVATLALLAVVLPVGGIWMYQHAAELFSIAGRDPTLTGRTILWAAVMDMIKQRFTLGYGFDAFWLGSQSDVGYIWRVTGWQPVHAHNGLLDLWLELGVVGTSAYLIGLGTLLVRGVRVARRIKSPAALWPLLFLSFLLLSNITESATVDYNDVFWVLYIAVGVVLCAPHSESPPRAVRIDASASGDAP